MRIYDDQGQRVAELNVADGKRYPDRIIWEFTPSLGPVSRTITYTLRPVDSSGNEGSQGESFQLSIDTDPPDAFALTGVYSRLTRDGLGPRLEPGSTLSNAITNVAVFGNLPVDWAPGDEILVYGENSSFLGNATADISTRTWRINDVLMGERLQHGHVLEYYAVAQDKAGNRTHSDNNYKISVMDETAPGATAPISSVTREILTDTILIEGTLTSPLQEGEFIRIRVGFNNVFYYVAPANAQGEWYLNVPRESWNEGATISFQAWVCDAAGNEGERSTYDIQVDWTAPTALPEILDFYDDVKGITGFQQSGAFTNDAQPLLRGALAEQLQPGEKIKIYSNENYVGDVDVDVDDIHWNWNRNHYSWTFRQPSVLLDGEVRYTAHITDAFGNLGPESSEFIINVETTAPELAPGASFDIYALVGAPVWESISNEASTAARNFLIRARLPAEPAGELHVFDGEVDLGLMHRRSAPSVEYDFFDLRELLDGYVAEYSVRVMDPVGNLSDAGETKVIHIDYPISISIARVDDDVLPDLGGVAMQGSTNDKELTLQGAVEGFPFTQGEKIAVYSSVISNQKMLLGYAAVSPDESTWSFEDTVTAHFNERTWSATTNGSVTYYVQIEDKNGDVITGPLVHVVNYNFSESGTYDLSTMEDIDGGLVRGDTNPSPQATEHKIYDMKLIDGFSVGSGRYYFWDVNGDGQDTPEDYISRHDLACLFGSGYAEPGLFEFSHIYREVKLLGSDLVLTLPTAAEFEALDPTLKGMGKVGGPGIRGYHTVTPTTAQEPPDSFTIWNYGETRIVPEEENNVVMKYPVVFQVV